MVERACKVDGCRSKCFMRGLCYLHYRRLERSGTTDDPAIDFNVYNRGQPSRFGVPMLTPLLTMDAIEWLKS